MSGGWVYASIPTDIVYSESYAAVKIEELYTNFVKVDIFKDFVSFHTDISSYLEKLLH